MSTKTGKPAVGLDGTRDRLERVGLLWAAEQMEALISEAVKSNTPPHRFLDRLLDEELRHREERRIRTSLKLSCLPTGQTLANFDFAFQPSLELSRIEMLATCQWIRDKRTLLIQGPPGVGKTHSGVALGVKVVEHGLGVMFYRLEGLLAAPRRDADLSPSRLRRREYPATSLLIIDEVGFEPMTRQEASCSPGA